jgi:hypothetical protein
MDALNEIAWENTSSKCTLFAPKKDTLFYAGKNM